eukprot:PRCOL_00005489-RA
MDADAWRAQRGDAGASAGGLLNAPCERAVLIEMVRGVDADTFWEALREALEPRIAEIATWLATAETESGDFMASTAEAAEVKEEAALDALDEMKAFFRAGGELKKGDRIELRWGGRGSAAVSVSASPSGRSVDLSSEEFGRALFAVYLDESAVAPEARDAFDGALGAL